MKHSYFPNVNFLKKIYFNGTNINRYLRKKPIFLKKKL